MNVFYNQALNTLFAYGYRASSHLLGAMRRPIKSYPLAPLRKPCANQYRH